MATHYCIGNPCLVCHPHLRPIDADDVSKAYHQVAVDHDKLKAVAKDMAEIFKTWEKAGPMKAGGTLELIYMVQIIKKARTMLAILGEE